jgi:hypothetical protein
MSEIERGLYEALVLCVEQLSNHDGESHFWHEAMDAARLAILKAELSELAR